MCKLLHILCKFKLFCREFAIFPIHKFCVKFWPQKLQMVTFQACQKHNFLNWDALELITKDWTKTKNEPVSVRLKRSKSLQGKRRHPQKKLF